MAQAREGQCLDRTRMGGCLGSLYEMSDTRARSRWHNQVFLSMVSGYASARLTQQKPSPRGTYRRSLGESMCACVGKYHASNPVRTGKSSRLCYVVLDDRFSSCATLTFQFQFPPPSLCGFLCYRQRQQRLLELMLLAVVPNSCHQLRYTEDEQKQATLCFRNHLWLSHYRLVMVDDVLPGVIGAADSAAGSFYMSERLF
ncbi:hypothetical protein SDJN02_25309, partial [Cucurbita argyrosperma subsp. argyrosperma]